MEVHLEEQNSTSTSSSSSEYSFDSPELDLQGKEREPTVLEYARFHRLCIDYSLEPLLVFDGPVLANDVLEADLKNPIDFPTTDVARALTKERLLLNTEAAILLKKIHLMQQASDDKIQLPSVAWRQAAKLKHEVPILQSDEELDLLHFGSTDTPSFTNSRIPLEVMNVERDEGFEWPTKYHAYPAQCDKQAKTEKLQILADDLRFLANAVKDNYTPENYDNIQEDSLNYTRNPFLQPLTPPLLPLSPPLTPYVPSSPDNHLEFLSESTDSLMIETKALEVSIMGADMLVRPDPRGSDTIVIQDDDLSQECSSFFEMPFSPLPKRKMEDLKVEGPLTPPMFSESPIKKTKSVSFPEMLHKYIPELPSRFESDDDVADSEDIFLGSFKEQLQPHAEKVMNNVENEKLSEVDTTMRVDIAKVDFSLPVAPWNEFTRRKRGKDHVVETELDAQMDFISRVKRNDLKSASSWPGLAKLERELPWMPFPAQLGSTTVIEKLHGENVLSKMLAELTTSDIATSSTEVWKRDGLRILEDDEDSYDEVESLDMGTIDERNDMDTLVRKKRLEMEDEGTEERCREKKIKAAASVFNVSASQPRETPREVVQSHFWNASGSMSRRNSPPRQTQRLSMRAQTSHVPPKPKEPDSSLMFGGMFSASTALHKFMGMMGKPVNTENKVEGRDSGPVQQSGPSVVALSGQTAKISPQSRTECQQAVAHSMHQEKLEIPRPLLSKLPSVSTSLPSCSFIISSTLLQQRRLTREIEKLYPRANFVQRDFTSPHSTPPEADLLLSPSTGLIFTTLQQMKQCALPGQPECSPLKERIARLQYRYERLVVLISEGLTRDMEEHGESRPIDESDKNAVTIFECFASKMEGEIIVKYVRGGEFTVSREIVGQMTKWGLPHGSRDMGKIRLLQDETCWELFLRRTGLNPFAAQVILASLDTPHQLPLSSSSPAACDTSEKTVEVSGLAELILMEAGERVKRFQALLGGSRILVRVNRMLDQEWPSAVNGFAV